MLSGDWLGSDSPSLLAIVTPVGKKRKKHTEVATRNTMAMSGSRDRLSRASLAAFASFYLLLSGELSPISSPFCCIKLGAVCG